MNVAGSTHLPPMPRNKLHILVQVIDTIYLQITTLFEFRQTNEAKTLFSIQSSSNQLEFWRCFNLLEATITGSMQFSLIIGFSPRFSSCSTHWMTAIERDQITNYLPVKFFFIHLDKWLNCTMHFCILLCFLRQIHVLVNQQQLKNLCTVKGTNNRTMWTTTTFSRRSQRLLFG